MNQRSKLFPGCLLISVLLFIAANVLAESPTPPPGGNDNYVPGPDSLSQPGIPRGKMFSFKLENSKIFPGTTRLITVYVPAQYRPEKPACVFVELDGLGFDAPVVFDNLINKGDMPVTIAIGIAPGDVPPATGKDDARHNRSFEFDGLNDSLARFVVDEVYPEVEKHQTPDGLAIKLSRDPNDACTGGGSTGGIAAFTLAWERPDLFRRVFSAIGTFVGMRGGDRYPVLVRKTEPKPIRVFQQDGENDEWMGGPEVGDWWMSNQTLNRALEFSGYEHQHIWGTGPHSGKHATAIFPDAMRYLWKDWPKPITAQTAKSQNVILKETLDPNSPWHAIDDAGSACDHLAVNPAGEVYFHDAAGKKFRKVRLDGRLEDQAPAPVYHAFTFGADGKALAVDGFAATAFVATSTGNLYATDADAGKVWLFKTGAKVLLDEGLKGPTGIALSPDGLWLVVFESRTHFGYSYRVKPDGTVDTKQKYYWVHVPDDADDSGAGTMCMDRDGHAYLATRMGVQIFDRNGRSRGILPMPTGEATSVCFGGAKFDTLYVTSGGKLYQRHMKAIGAPGFLAPIKLPPWGAG
ncbi:MAG TPA: SMP-30/gluconolactonase/LRE family protein [Tepidisphaeraceae bacterium]|jgi:enterochelin esterase-like enzyme|nr:SMP-30/gluconolactonase/LRE family protein [Tepidisphaeraceae bacterium]